MTQRRTVLDIPLFHKTYELYKVLHSYHERISKSQRYTLWQKCENTALVLLETILQAGYSKTEEKTELLYIISSKVDLLKVLIRLAKETRTLNPKQYLEVQTILQEIGKMVGGWLKSVAHAQPQRGNMGAS